MNSLLHKCYLLVTKEQQQSETNGQMPSRYTRNLISPIMIHEPWFTCKNSSMNSSNTHTGRCMVFTMKNISVFMFGSSLLRGWPLLSGIPCHSSLMLICQPCCVRRNLCMYSVDYIFARVTHPFSTQSIWHRLTADIRIRCMQIN